MPRSVAPERCVKCRLEPVERLDFTCKSGPLSVTREGGQLWLDFPAIIASPVSVTPEIERALGVKVVEARGSSKLLVVLESEQAVLVCKPDMAALAKLPWSGAIVTAPGKQHDFVSHYFAPAIGINEDSVTGSAHCLLIPYWSEQLDRAELTAFQRSARGGELFYRLEGQRVKIGGKATLVARGSLMLG